MNQSDVVQTIINRFSSKDIRLTPQRISVYRYLLENRIHPSVETVYNALKADNPSLSKTTIYNTVDTLTREGLVKAVRTACGEVRLDGFTENHGHFYCRICEGIFDFSLEGCHVPDSLDGFQMEEFDVHAVGLCESCGKNGQ